MQGGVGRHIRYFWKGSQDLRLVGVGGGQWLPQKRALAIGQKLLSYCMCVLCMVTVFLPMYTI